MTTTCKQGTSTSRLTLYCSNDIRFYLFVAVCASFKVSLLVYSCLLTWSDVQNASLNNKRRIKVNFAKTVCPNIKLAIYIQRSVLSEPKLQTVNKKMFLYKIVSCTFAFLTVISAMPQVTLIYKLFTLTFLKTENSNLT